MNLADLQIDMTNTLNHNGFNDVKIVTNNSEFSIRVNYWEQIPASLIETMEEYHSIRITEHTWEDEDCGELFRYVVEVVDEDAGYTLNELNELESNYIEEAEFLHKYESGDIWGVA
jgi:hypothetical protein